MTENIVRSHSVALRRLLLSPSHRIGLIPLSLTKSICRRLLTILNLAGLLDLANLYCEEKLKKKCEKLIKQSISVENAAMLLDASIKYNAKVSYVTNSPLDPVRMKTS